MGVRHPFVSQKADGPDPTRIQPQRDWNAAHLTPGWLGIQITDAAAAAWSNMPAALTELRGLLIWRTRIDLTQVDQVRVSAFIGVIGSPSSRVEAQYSANNGASWYSLASVNGLSASAGPFVPLGSISGAPNKTLTSAWTPIHPSARSASTIVRMAGYWGDGVADPTFGQVSLFIL